MDVSLLAFAFISLTLFFALITLLSIIRLYKAIVSKLITRMGIVFYSVLTATLIIRTVGFSLYADDNMDIEGKRKYPAILINILITLPEMLNIYVYIFLCWYYLANFLASYCLLADDLSIFLNDGYTLIKTVIK